ncbi:hypothetical protein T265_01153 [Opisthorchis viverrini]|uniref:Uncharacterized protein n=1 Tax=Opisthorchis viverrini TaxID=6198 RepID=A0A075A3M0_OPIVI|nr:hypothetical protein T265_01153 [Opisthorchis viverrini]KER32867.1 hypothetical protein T265_01153 [Opisthorchis viverrini]
MAHSLKREFTDRQVRGSNSTSAFRPLLSRLVQPGGIPALALPSGGMVRGSNSTSAFRPLLSRLVQPGGIPALALPSGGMVATHRNNKASHTKKRRRDEQPDMPELPLADPLRDSVNLELPDLVHIAGVDLDLFDMMQTSLYQARVEDITLMEENVNLIPVSNLTFGEELAFSSGMDLIQLTDNDVAIRAAATDKVASLSPEESRRRPLCDVDQVVEPEAKIPRVQSAVLGTVTEIEEPRLLPADPSVYAIPDQDQITLGELNAFQSNGTFRALDGTVVGPSGVTSVESRALQLNRILVDWHSQPRITFGSPTVLLPLLGATWLEREFTDRKVRGSDPTFAFRLPLSRLAQPNTALVLPSGGITARHRKGAIVE